jgi:Flp pilus assembly protein TadG
VRKGRSDRGAATVYFLLLTIVVLGLLVFATDVGRLYLIQGELQTAADAAALAAATRLQGTASATGHAANQITASFDSTNGNDNRFNLRLNQIGASGSLATTTQVDYFSTLEDAIANVNSGQTGAIDWATGLYPKYVRVQITAQAPVAFAPSLTRTAGFPSITVSAIAGLSTAICTACGIEGLAIVDQSGDTDDPVNYGLMPGAFYTLSLTTSNPFLGSLPNTVGTVQYVILNHTPSGAAGLDSDSSFFELGAAAISNTPGLDPPGAVSVGSVEVINPDYAPANINTIGRDILCGMNVRFAVAETACDPFADLAAQFTADSDAAGDRDADTGLQDYAVGYDGNARRILTLPVVDAPDTLNVLNFRQFLVEPAATTQGVDVSASNGAFRAQYLGMPVPMRCGGVGGFCNNAAGPGRSVLH